MPNEELFSGIPALDDTAGLESYMNNDTLANMGVNNDNTPAALQMQSDEPPTSVTAPSVEGNPDVPQYTSEQVAQIVARNQQLEAQVAQANVQPQQQPIRNSYTPRQAAIIKDLIDRGVPLERINAALNRTQAEQFAQNQLAQRLANLEGYLQRQQYEAAQNEFVNKMTTFGGKFGLTENDLVTFGNKAMSMGINLTTVSDVEAVFRAVYPEQYAIRSQRMAGSSASQIYGGSSAAETPRASASKLEDAYVEQYLKHAMPNLYNMNTK